MRPQPYIVVTVNPYVRVNEIVTKAIVRKSPTP